jgi:nucleotidyltransferase substrate binding protein (TIGR01987 family)
MNDPNIHRNFGRALERLREFAGLAIENDRDRAGIIQAFEFTFEQCWKAFQRYAAAEGIEAHSPRESLMAAMQLQLIRAADEEHWLQMLRDRNLTSHLYHEKLARQVSDRIREEFLPLLIEAHHALTT